MSARRVAASFVGAAALLAVLLVPLGRAQAAGVEYGWWSASGSPGGSPSGAPTNGLYAAVGPSIPGVTIPVPNVAGGEVPAAFSPVAVGAVRFPADPTSEATLTLDITASSTPPTDAMGNLTFGLLACPISDPTWVPVQNGSFANRPKYDCGGIAAVGAVATDGKQAAFSLSPIFQSPAGLYDVAIVVLGQSTAFFSFGAPTSGSARIAPPAAEPDPEPAADSASATPAGTADPPGFAAGVDSIDNSSVIDGGSLPNDAPVELAPETAPEPASTDQAIPVTRLPPAARAAATARDGWRLFFAVVLVVLAGGLFWAAGQRTRLPRLIGPLGSGAVAEPVPDEVEDPTVHGIGRYARARVGSPRLLR